MRIMLAAFAATAILVTACQNGNDAAGPEQPVTPAPPEAPAETEDGDGDADGGGSTEESPAGAIDPRSDHPVEAQPGRWAIADAGFVEFGVADGGLELVDVTESEGWSARVDEDSSDEIEVDFTRDATDIQVEIERDDSALEIDIDTDIEPADTGRYELGQAGSMEFDVRDGGLVLNDVTANDGWDLRMDEETTDEVEFILTGGDERWRVEIELDDGEVELELDYRVRGTG